MGKKQDLTGRKIGRLTVVSQVSKPGREWTYWKCICSCGIERVVIASSLIRGQLIAVVVWQHNGSKRRNWNPNLTDRIREDRRKTLAYKEWRKAVFERDGYTCIVTGKRGNIHTQHIVSWHSLKEGQYDVANGVTLLKEVHKAFHKQYGMKNNTREQFEEFLISQKKIETNINHNTIQT